MRVLGLSANYHSSSAVIVSENGIECGSLEERYSHIKHDSSFPHLATERNLEYMNMRASQLDFIAFYEEPENKFLRVLVSELSSFPRNFSSFYRAISVWLSEKLWPRLRIVEHLNVKSKIVKYVDHHLSHATFGFYNSNVEKSIVIVCDAVGEWDCTTAYIFEKKEGRFEYTKIESSKFPNSIGLLYSAFTKFVGFKPNSEECSFMALAAFGTPVYKDEVLSVFNIKANSKYKINDEYLDFTKNNADLFKQKFYTLFGQPNSTNNFEDISSWSSKNMSTDTQKFADMASSVQHVLENFILDYANELKMRYQISHLTFTGGVALNCKLNAKLLKESNFDLVDVPFEPGDGGASIGAALNILSNYGNVPINDNLTPYIGIAPLIDNLDEVIKGWVKLHNNSDSSFKIQLQPVKQETYSYEIASLLNDKKIVAICRGKFEFGPRSLGNRSILAVPDCLEVALKLSESVKRRAKFRPYALSMSDSFAKDCFSLTNEQSRVARWMQYSFSVNERYVSQVKYGLHIDGTTRPHICYESDNKAFFDILKSLNNFNRPEALINTSLNLRGYPIVDDPITALALYVDTALDVLVLDKWILKKVKHA